MSNSQIAAALTELADLLELLGENAFRVRAYRNAARTIDSLPDEVTLLLEQSPDALLELEGIGKDLAQKISSLATTGQLGQLEDVRSQVPPGVVQMLKIPGLGPKKVATLWKELQVNTLDDLQAAATAGRVAELKGFGKKTEQSILEGISLAAEAGRRVLISVAREAAEKIAQSLRNVAGVERVEIAGSARRWKETCGDLDLLAIAADSTAAMDELSQHPLVSQVVARGETKQHVRLKSGIDLDLRVVPPESFGAAWQYFTGSKEHNVVMRRLAQEKGLKLNEYGLFRGEEMVAGTDEESIYKTLGLPWIPPEMRENRGEFQLQGRIDLIQPGDLQGDLHMHTTATDGAGSIEEMIEGARATGLKYIAITDHSKRVAMANGLDSVRLREHWRKIDLIRQKTKGIEVLCGIECDILEDATLDLPDEVLAEADWVIAVLHYGLRQPAEMIEKRLLAAIQNPHVDCIGHPSGRLIGSRAPAEINYHTFLKAAQDYGVMLEINANPARLDLNDIQSARAKELRIPIVINSDSHHIHGFQVLEYGVHQARRAGLTKADVANTLDFASFRQLIRRNR
ncbi:DNA polymerase/3'-5' exonuclease PolX [Planctopirus ephydatiae]|uniref:DNA polymerase beta n=1 Tax=Planctopirus ephydatiae TaxID=2528019 RepID=A0A518GPU9_9PLAN|nr:DNA polymerase/3'-5' exonuclease PolX [Planctopirus ephydatiae]QDV30648.1 DNA polymerase/3'-5' exonuclease PolX [Planctopirus ephydatiae]